MSILTPQSITDPNYFRTALRSHQAFAGRCLMCMARAETEAEREDAREQLRSAEREIAYWQARLEASRG